MKEPDIAPARRPSAFIILVLSFLSVLAAAFTLAVSARRRPLPLEMPPATQGAVSAPDPTEAKKFVGTWQSTRQIHRTMDSGGKRIDLVATRSTEIVIRPDQTLFVSVKVYADSIDPEQEALKVALAQGDRATIDMVQGYAPGSHSYSGQWSQQKDAHGNLWVMRQNSIAPPFGLYYRFGPADKEGQSKSVVLTGTPSPNLRMTDDVTGDFTRVR